MARTPPTCERSSPQVRPRSVAADSIEELRSQNLSLVRELAQLRAENTKLKVDSALLEQVLSSRIWRATQPIRVALRFVKGEFRFTRHLFARLQRALPQRRFAGLRRALQFLASSAGSSANSAALQEIVDRRCTFDPLVDPARAPFPAEWPALDLSVVTFNGRKWLRPFLESIAAQDYPLEKMHIRFVDHGSRDRTRVELDGLREEYAARLGSFEVLESSNRGFGAGHNVGIRAGQGLFCLVSNVDLTFEKDSLTRIVAMACADQKEVACWELRQKPYEHPKFYDPVSLETNWCSHACVLLRRSSFEAVGGYDEAIFMYGEDVELSYRFRQRGLRLRYCPGAVVWHFTYEHADQIKPLQYCGSAFANFYLRLRYGTWADVVAIIALAAHLLAKPEVYDGSRRDVRHTLLRVLRAAPSALALRRRSSVAFPFRAYDYDLVREGAFVASEAEPTNQPLVSVVTRTFAGRADLLRQAMFSVAHQTYTQLELVVVEDGGEANRETVARVSKATGMPVIFVSVPKGGRSAAGNAGLAATTGDFVMFLDDDDLLFADHVSTLMQALRNNSGSVGAYSLAWEVPSKPKAGGGHSEQMPILHAHFQQSFDSELLRRMNYIPIQAMLFRRSLYLERGGLDPEIDCLEDWNLWNKYAVANCFSYVPKVTSLFRTPADPLIARTRQKALDRAYSTVLSRNSEMIAAMEEATIRRQLLTVPQRERAGGRSSSACMG